MTKLAHEWVRTSDPVIRSPACYRWTTAPAWSADGWMEWLRRGTKCLWETSPLKILTLISCSNSSLFSTTINLYLLILPTFTNLNCLLSVYPQQQQQQQQYNRGPHHNNRVAPTQQGHYGNQGGGRGGHGGGGGTTVVVQGGGGGGYRGGGGDGLAMGL